MIEVKVKHIVENINMFTDLSQRHMQARTAFKVARILSSVVAEYNRYNEVKNQVIEEYTKRDQEGHKITDENGNYLIQEGREQECMQTLDELMDHTISLNVEPLQLREIEEFEFTPSQMYGLMPFIEE